MSVSMKEVLQVLEPDEPKYDKAAALGPESLPHLRTLVEGDDPMLAAKAAYAASLLEGDQGQDVVVAAAHSATASIRVAAAAAAGNLPTESASAVLMDLVGDTDAGVRKVALSAIPGDAPPELTDKVNALSRKETDESTAGPPQDQALTGIAMPGERQNIMPGEQPAAGLMPGEKPASSAENQQDKGLMPGETR